MTVTPRGWQCVAEDVTRLATGEVGDVVYHVEQRTYKFLRYDAETDQYISLEITPLDLQDWYEVGALMQGSPATQQRTS